MDALQLLESEHDDLEALVAKLEQARGAEARHLFTAVKDQYELIKALEGTYLYPQLRDDDLARDIVLEGSVEHSVIDTLLDELSQVKPDDPLWQPKVHVLTLALEHHVPEEETQLFPKVRLIWDSDKLRSLYHKMESFKAEWKRDRDLVAEELSPPHSDEDVKKNIAAALVLTAEIDAQRIQVSVNGSTAILKGSVRSFAEREAAERAAWSVPGITSVENYLVVKD
jgi:hemerythrin superfamily protein